MVTEILPVIGSNRVLFYDAARWGRQEGGDGAAAWFSLGPGERFDLGTRRRVVPSPAIRYPT